MTDDKVIAVTHVLLMTRFDLHRKMFPGDIYACEVNREHLFFDIVMFEPRCDECFTIAVGFAENGYDHHARPLSGNEQYIDLTDFIKVCQRYREIKNAPV